MVKIKLEEKEAISPQLFSIISAKTGEDLTEEFS
jgi:hypothetical protein